MRPLSVVMSLTALIYTTVASGFLESFPKSIFARQASQLPACRLNYTTTVWTNCTDVLAQFELSLDQFLYANPQLGDACDGFAPGKTYCVSRRKSQIYESQRGMTYH